MMKCDMCYDRTSVGLKPMCASVCPSQALWFGTPERVRRHPHRHAGQRVVVRQPVRRDQGPRPSCATPAPIDVLAGGGVRRMAGRPLRPRRAEEREPPRRDDRSTEPIWRDDFPFTSAGEDEVTRREFVRYLVLASGGFAAGSVGVALWSSLRSINTGEPRPIVALDDVPEDGAYLFRYPTKDDPAILVHLPGGELRAFSQKCTHLGCVVYYEADTDEMACPCHEGVFDARLRQRDRRAHRSGRSGASTSRCATAPSGPLGAEPLMTAPRRHRDGGPASSRRRSACSSSCSSRCRCSCSPSASTRCSPTRTGWPG